MKLVNLAVALLLGIAVIATLQRALAQPVIDCRPTIAHWEFTQGVQTGSNTVALIDGRRTTIRLFVTHPLGCEDIDNVTAELVFAIGGQFVPPSAGQRILPDKDETMTVTNSFSRHNDATSLEFTFTPNSAGASSTSSVMLLLDACPRPKSQLGVPCEFWQYSAVELIHRVNPIVFGVGIDHIDGPRQNKQNWCDRLPEKHYLIEGVADASMQALYPFRDSGAYYLLPFDCQQQFRHIVTFSGLGLGGRFALRDHTSAGVISLLNQLKIVKNSIAGALREECENGTVAGANVFGWLHPDEGSAIGNYFGLSAPSFGVGWAYAGDTQHAPGLNIEDTYQGTLSHELGHLWFSPATAQSDGHDQSLIDQIGWDTLLPDGALRNGRFRNPANQFNVMATAPNGGILTTRRWTQFSQYNAVMNAVMGTGSQSGQGCSKSFASSETVIANGMPGGDWTVQPIFSYEKYQEPIVPSSEGSAEIRALDSNDSVVYSSRFNTDFFYDESTGQINAQHFALEIPAGLGYQTLQLYDNSQLKASVERSSSAPQVTITSPQSGDSIDTNTLLAWTAMDPDGDALSAVIRYSHDGETWLVLSFIPSEPQLILDMIDELPGSQHAILQVLVSDGINTTSASVVDLRNDINHSPVVTLLSPTDGAVLYQRSNVILHARVLDIEDLIFDLGESPSLAQTVQWYSNIDGSLAIGPIANVTNLSVGHHVISVVVSDSGGSTSSSSVSIEVLP